MLSKPPVLSKPEPPAGLWFDRANVALKYQELSEAKLAAELWTWRELRRPPEPRTECWRAQRMVLLPLGLVVRASASPLELSPPVQSPMALSSGSATTLVSASAPAHEWKRMPVRP